MSKAPDRFSPASREAAKILATAQAQVSESERMITRQKALLEEIRASGLRTDEAEASMVRLEAAFVERRAKLDAILQARQAPADALDPG